MEAETVTTASDPATLHGLWRTGAQNASRTILVACVAIGLIGLTFVFSADGVSVGGPLSFASTIVGIFGIRGLIAKIPAERLSANQSIFLGSFCRGLEFTAVMAALGLVAAVLRLFFAGGVGLMRA